MIYGGVLIAFMWVLPEGAAGLPRRLRELVGPPHGGHRPRGPLKAPDGVPTGKA